MSFPAAELPVGAGWLSLSPLPRGPADIAGLKAWGADLLISLTEAPEMSADFRLWLDGLAWLHLPVADYGVPDQALPVQDLGARLAAGQRLAIHCRGGCGRSGMLALRLMIWAREPADAALARLRAVRPCAIETPDQLTWAMGAIDSADSTLSYPRRQARKDP